MLIGILILTLTFTNQAASAAGSVTGDLVFSCTATLPVWPTAMGPAFACGGRVTGIASVVITGGGRYNLVALNDVSTWSFSDYDNTCSLGLPPLTFFGGGVLSVSGLVSLDGTTSGAFNVPFFWAMTGGSEMLINLGPGGTLTLSNGQTATVDTPDSTFDGVGVLLIVNPIPLPTCTNPRSVAIRAWGAIEF